MAPAAVFHCELAWLGGDAPVADVRVDVSDGAVAAVTAGAAPPPGATRLGGLVLPGLANAHSHAFHRALRGRTHAGAGTFWTWRDEMYRVAAALDPDTYHRLATAVYGEMLLAGITCVGEFHYLHHAPDGTPYADPNAMGAALLAAAAAVGLRITLLDTCYLGAGVAPDATLRPPEGVQVRYADASAEAWAQRVDALAENPGARVGAAVHSVRAVPQAAITTVAAWAGERSRPLHAHVSEQPAENEQCLAAYGLTPVGVLAGAGALDQAFTAVHATHLSPADIASLGASNGGVCVCPTTERDLADGIGPTVALATAGAALCLGTDSHAVIDLLEEARALELDERLASGRRGNHPVPALLHAATAAGHGALGWPEAGRIEPGAPADLVALSLRSVRTAGTRPADAPAAAVFAATAADVTDVVVGGQHVVRGGRHRSVDVTTILAEVLGP
jgi:formiminoglutamate deiminase